MIDDGATRFLADTVIGASYVPGFQTDLTSWTLVIDSAGTLVQTLETMVPLRKRDRHAVVRVNQNTLLAWIRQAEVLDFAALALAEQRAVVDDMATYTLAIRFATIEKAVTLRALDWLIRDGHQEMRAFRDLWDSIHAIAPFPQTYRPWRGQEDRDRGHS